MHCSLKTWIKARLPEHPVRRDESLANPSYRYQKKQREEAQRKKRVEKEQRKAERKGVPAPPADA